MAFDTQGKARVFEKIRAAFLLSKPRLSSFVVLSGAGGFGLAATHPDHLHQVTHFFFFVLALSLVVAAANTHNCYLEKDVDAKMTRTKDRPLVTGVLSSRFALALGFVELSFALIIFYHYSNLLTVFLGFLGYASYVLFYTPLKRLSMSALFVGAIPGALPPMMGWTAVTNNLGLGAWILFGILFVWQLPHFIAISLNRLEEYKAAGLFTVPGSLGVPAAQRHMVIYTIVLLLLTFAPFFANLAGWFYVAVSSLLFFGCVLFTFASFFQNRKLNWNRVIFLGSLAYLPLVLGAWVFDRWLLMGSIS